MPPTRKTPVTSLSLPTAVRDRANLLALSYGPRIGRRVSMAAVIGAALDLAERHPDELAALLSAPGGDPS